MNSQRTPAKRFIKRSAALNVMEVTSFASAFSRCILEMMSKALFIVLALWATLPSALCQTACDEMSRAMSTIAMTQASSSASGMGSHCAEMGAMASSPGATASSEEDSSCEGCDAGVAILLPASIGSGDDAELRKNQTLAVGLEIHSARRNATKAPSVPRAPPDWLGSPYSRTKRPLLI
jgi:hypothetical protein